MPNVFFWMTFVSEDVHFLNLLNNINGVINVTLKKKRDKDTLTKR